MKIALFALILILTACGSTAPQRQDFLLNSARSAPAVASATLGKLQVLELQAHPPYRNLALIYKESPQRFVADPYHGFLAPLAQQISSQTRNWLAQSGAFSAVLSPSSAIDADWQLEGELQAAYVDVSIPAAPKVNLTVRYTASKGNTVHSWPLSQTVAIDSAQPEHAVIGFNRALNALLLQLESSLLADSELH